jgi:apolipoprotein N-acyltransferase
MTSGPPASIQAARSSLTRLEALAFAGCAVAAFHGAYAARELGFLMAVYLFSLLQLAGLSSSRQAFYLGLTVGLLSYAPHLWFFTNLFSWRAAALWVVLAFWLGLFVALAQVGRQRWGWTTTALLAPFLWTGLEYFRSELYYLRFSWLNAGYAFSELPGVYTATHLGMYGIGFALMALAAIPLLLGQRTGRRVFILGTVALGAVMNGPLKDVQGNGDSAFNGFKDARIGAMNPRRWSAGVRPGAVTIPTRRAPDRRSALRFMGSLLAFGARIGAMNQSTHPLTLALSRASGGEDPSSVALDSRTLLVAGLRSEDTSEKAARVGNTTLLVAGIQMEFPQPEQVVHALDSLVRHYPEAPLLVLSEYTFDGPVPEPVKDWCRANRRYLIAGGKEPGGVGDQFHNTAFVIGPEGQIVHRQAKAVPIQFFNDGLPSREQRVWNSPWGKIGLCICYDLSYRRVTDELIRQGAQAIIVPTMDVAEWGKHQHDLHARVGPVRAAEYQVPVVRIASSGISQIVDQRGRVIAWAPFPGQMSIMAGQISLKGSGHLPWDRWLAPFSTAITAAMILWLAIALFLQRRNPPGPVTAPHSEPASP